MAPSFFNRNKMFHTNLLTTTDDFELTNPSKPGKTWPKSHAANLAGAKEAPNSS